MLEGSNIPVWEDGAWEGLPSLAGDVATDVCVVGLGGSGLACVTELVRLGRRVVGIDGTRVGGGAAGRNGGFLLAGAATFYHDTVKTLGRERSRYLYRLTLAEIGRFVAETPDLVRQTGSLRIAADAAEAEDCRRQLSAMAEDELPVEGYEGPEGSGLLFPADAVFEPLRRCRGSARRLVSLGVPLYEDTRAVEVSGTEVVTPRGRIRCDQVVVAVDGGLERLLPELVGKVRTARLQMLATAPAPEVRFRYPVYRRYGYDYYQQTMDGRIILGGFRDQGGDEEWTDSAVPSEAIQGRLDTFLREALGVIAPVTHRWAGVVGYAAGPLPLIEQVRPGVWAMGGYSGTGNIIGAIYGRALANLVTRGESALAEVFHRPFPA